MKQKMASKGVTGVRKDLSAAKKRVQHEFNKAKTKLNKVQQHAEGYIAKNPKQATAIAVGVGAAIGAAITAYLMKDK